SYVGAVWERVNIIAQAMVPAYADQGRAGADRNGPHAGSRTSPSCRARRWCTRPSEDTAASSEPPGPLVVYRIMDPFGAKLGDSSSRALLRICARPSARPTTAMR